MKTGHRAQRRPACASLETVSRPPKVKSSMRTQSATVRRKSLIAPRDPLVTLRGGAAEASASRVEPWGALGSRPRRVLGSHPSHPRERVRVCAQLSLAIEGRICGSRGHVTRVAAGSRARGRRWRQSRVAGGVWPALYVSRSMLACSVPMVRRAGSNVRASWSRDLVSASGRCHCDRATGCCRQPARAGARNSSMPSAGGGPCLPVTILWRLGSNLRAAWSRYGVAMLGHRGRRVVPMGVAGSRPTQVRGFHSCRPHAGVLV